MGCTQISWASTLDIHTNRSCGCGLPFGNDGIGLQKWRAGVASHHYDDETIGIFGVAASGEQIVDGASEGLSGGPLRKLGGRIQLPQANKELLMASYGHGMRDFVVKVDVALQIHEECRGSGNMGETSRSVQAGNFALQELETLQLAQAGKELDTLQSAPAGDFESVQAGDLASDVPAECGLGGTTGRIGGSKASTPGPSGSMEPRGRGEITRGHNEGGEDLEVPKTAEGHRAEETRRQLLQAPVLCKIRARSASAQFPGCNWSRNSRGETCKGATCRPGLTGVEDLAVGSSWRLWRLCPTRVGGFAVGSS